jgi:hypothetical protein
MVGRRLTMLESKASPQSVQFEVGSSSLTQERLRTKVCLSFKGLGFGYSSTIKG